MTLQNNHFQAQLDNLVFEENDKQTIDEFSPNTCDDCQMMNTFVLNMAISVRWIERLNLFGQSVTNFALLNKIKTVLMVLLLN